MKKIVDIYIPLDAREKPNEVVMAVARPQLEHLKKVIRSLGWQPNVLNPDKPVSSVAEGLRVIRKAKGSRFINFMAGWAYPDFSVSPMCSCPKKPPNCFWAVRFPISPGR